MIEEEWRGMLREKNSIPEIPDGSFVEYVKWYAKEHRS